jgi:hypothetical protein
VVWRELWKLPQAVVWDEQRMQRQVAFYVRTSVEAEEFGSAVTRRTALLQQENVLLLNPTALLKAGFRISTNAARSPAAPAAKAAPMGNVVDFRSRWKGSGTEDDPAPF